jgi:hypothetical protein
MYLVSERVSLLRGDMGRRLELTASSGRDKSLLPGISSRALSAACRCIIHAAPSGTWTRNKNQIALTARLPGKTYAGCPAAAYASINNEYKNAATFCTFWTSGQVISLNN